MSLLAGSIGRKIVATIVVSVGFVFVYETTIRDSRYAARQAMLQTASGAPLPGTRLLFHATAYCKGTTTASGVNVRTGIAAADPTLLPVGSVISINTGETKYTGIYTIMDTGPAVRGRTLDVYMWSCYEALAFGRKQVQVTVLRLGWNPRASTPGIIDALFRSRQVKKPTEPAPAAPSAPPAPPDAGALGTTAPGTTAPGVTAPSTNLPATHTPGGIAPTTSAPGVTAPAPNVPGASAAPAVRPPTER